MSWKICVDFKRATLEISSSGTGRVEHNKITALPGKNPKLGKTETYLKKTILWFRRIILREQENVFLFEFGLIVPTVLCVYSIPMCIPMFILT